MSLQNKRIIITGASRGIGLALSVEALKRGALVGANYNQTPYPKARFADHASCIMPLYFDVRNYRDADLAIDAFVKRYGQIDILINNAGIGLTKFLLRQTEEDIRNQIDINIIGVMNITKIACKHMMRTGGLIINVSSIASANPFAGNSVYAATKGAIESFSRAVSVEYQSRSIQAFSLRLGPVNTEMLRAIPEVGGVDCEDMVLGDYMVISQEEAAQRICNFLSMEKSNVVDPVIDLNQLYRSPRNLNNYSMNYQGSNLMDPSTGLI